jgi:glutathione synthase/RimK-type ligase-like ATP-grasp enzyme
VLKKPDSAFSLGVIKLNDMQTLKKALIQFFKTSDLVLLQPFIPTEYDWRIGIIDHKPLFACRYYMAKDHWQIYNWSSTQETEGEFDTVPLDQVPEGVIKTALKATRLIGDSLYGVDIKSQNDKHYIIEVNDNPNIDANIEDQIMGHELYRSIMSVFLQRIRRKHGYV